MKLGRMIGLVIVAGVLLFVTASYVQYSDYTTQLKSNGSWSVDLAGAVYLTGGSVTTSISTFRAQYNAHPEIQSFDQYLGQKFKGNGERQGSIPLNETFIKLTVEVTATGENNYHQTLLDKTTNIPYAWAGGTYGQNGEIGTFSYNLGPYIANEQFSPIKITAKLLIDGTQQLTQTYYLSIPAQTASSLGVTYLEKVV